MAASSAVRSGLSGRSATKQEPASSRPANRRLDWAISTAFGSVTAAITEGRVPIRFDVAGDRLRGQVEVADELLNVTQELLRRRSTAGNTHRGRGPLVQTTHPRDSQVDPIGIKGLQRPEAFRHQKRRVQ